MAHRQKEPTILKKKQPSDQAKEDIRPEMIGTLIVTALLAFCMANYVTLSFTSKPSYLDVLSFHLPIMTAIGIVIRDGRKGFLLFHSWSSTTVQEIHECNSPGHCFLPLSLPSAYFSRIVWELMACCLLFGKSAIRLQEQTIGAILSLSFLILVGIGSLLGKIGPSSHHHNQAQNQDQEQCILLAGSLSQNKYQQGDSRSECKVSFEAASLFFYATVTALAFSVAYILQQDLGPDAYTIIVMFHIMLLSSKSFNILTRYVLMTQSLGCGATLRENRQTPIDKDTSTRSSSIHILVVPLAAARESKKFLAPFVANIPFLRASYNNVTHWALRVNGVCFELDNERTVRQPFGKSYYLRKPYSDWCDGKQETSMYAGETSLEIDQIENLGW